MAWLPDGHAPKNAEHLAIQLRVEVLHRIIRKLIKGKAAWVSDTARIKQIYLCLMHNERSWKRNASGWKAIQRDLQKMYGERFSRHLIEN